MVKFPPLSPSSLWSSVYLKGLVTGIDPKEAILNANTRLISPKEFGRYVLIDSRGEEEIMSLAVEGGGRQLRDIDKIPELRLSEHGDWRKAHLGAIEANLGRRPFYRHLENGIRNVYSNKQLTTLEDFNTAIFTEFFSFLLGNMTADDLALFYKNPVLQQRGEEIAKEIQPQISLLQPLSIFGKETLLGLLSLEGNHK